MEASKVRVEIVEAVGDGTFNSYAHESGSVGKSEPGVDLCYALDCCPRPLLVLARAILTMHERHKLKGLAGELVKAAQKYADGWEESDATIDGKEMDATKMDRIQQAHAKLHGTPGT